MSLESAIESLAKSVEALVNTVAAISANKTSTPPVEKADAPAPAAAPQKRAPGRPAKAAATEDAPTTGETTAAPIKYETVREAILKLAETKGHSVAVATLAKFGAKTGKDLKPEQYAAALEACNEA